MTETTDVQAAVLAWLDEDPTRGYKRAEKQFGVAASTVKSWAQAHRAGKAPPRPNARTRARATPEPPAPAPEPTWDPTTCSREEFLADRIRECMEARTAALTAGHGGVARQWETTVGDYREELDALRDEQRRREEARGRTAEVTPADLATRLLRSIPGLARVAPDLAREIWLELGRAIGEWRE